MELEIKNFTINANDIPETGELRNFSIQGNKGAEFIMIIANASGNFYSFVDNTFSAGHTPQKVLKKTITGRKYNGTISFPNQAGQNYDILLIPGKNSFISKGIINKRIVQLGDVTLTFNYMSINNSSSYKTLPSAATVTNNQATSGISSISIVKLFENADTDANGFGLVTNRSLLDGTLDLVTSDKAWMFRTTTTVSGAHSSTATITLASVNDLTVDMLLSDRSAYIQSIDIATNTVTLSATKSFSDGDSITFDAIGWGMINSLLNATISATLRVQGVTAPSTTVRSAVSNSTTVTLNGTYGIPGGDIAVYSGTNVNNSSTNTVTRNRTADGNNVASSSAGEMVVTLAQTFKGSEILTFSHKDHPNFQLFDTFTIDGIISVSKFPSSNATIFFNLDEVITPGTTS